MTLEEDPQNTGIKIMNGSHSSGSPASNDKLNGRPSQFLNPEESKSDGRRMSRLSKKSNGFIEGEEIDIDEIDFHFKNHHVPRKSHLPY